MHFVQKNFGWEVKNSNLFFLSKQVKIQIDTKTDSEDIDVEIFDEQKKILNLIYSNWDKLVEIIILEILQYEDITKDKLLDVFNLPRIWLSVDYKSKLPPENLCWSFVLGVTENEDFA